MMMQMMKMTSLAMMMMTMMRKMMMMITFLRNLFPDEKTPKLSKWPWRR